MHYRNLFFILILLSAALFVSGQNLITIPEILQGKEINLNLIHSTKEFYPGIQTKTLAYNGNYLGKTIMLEKGQTVRLNVTNSLTEMTTTHWHGLHVAPRNDGSPHTPIEPRNTWSPEFTVLDKAGTYWYHPHLHGKTLNQVVKGAAGLIIVKDEEESALALPRSYGIDDIPLIFQFQTFDNNKQIVEEDEADNVILVNGTVNGMVKCPAQIIRLRLLNASSHRVFRFGFEGNHSFYQITSDAGLLNKPVQLTRLTLGSGERAEIIVDLSTFQGKSLIMKTFGNELGQGFPGGPPMMGMQAGPLDNKTTNILIINVGDKLPNALTTIPQILTNNDIWSQSEATARNLGFSAQPMMSMTNFFINNAKYDEGIINFKTKLNNTEVWTLTNQTMMAHPFHIHGNHFYILSINGQAPSENMKGRKDVVLVPPMNGSVKLITKYEDFADNEMPYMYHCHILSHEDDGMMGQFIVSDQLSGMNEDKISKNQWLKIWPNPATNFIELSNVKEFEVNDVVTIYDIQGKIVYNKLNNLSPKQKIKVDIVNWPSSRYYVKIGNSTMNAASFIKK